MIILEQKTKDGNFIVDVIGENKYSIYSLLKTKIPNKYWDKNIKRYIISPFCYYDLIDAIQELFSKELIITSSRLERKIIKNLGAERVLLDLQKEGLMVDGEGVVDGESGAIDLPKTFSKKQKLPLYQQAGVKYLLAVKKGIEGDVVGLGKTVISMTAAMKLMEEEEYDYCLVICPATLKRKWLKDILKFYPKVSVQIIEGNKKRREAGWNLLESYYFSIANYDILLRDINHINIVVKEETKNILICDEIQYCKNHNAKRSKLTKQIAKNFDKVFGLSASYMENSLLDLHSVMQIIRPAVLGNNVWEFEARYIERDFFGNVKAYKNVKEITRKVNPFIIRRYKEQVLEQLPKRNEIDYWVELSKSQRKFYNNIIDRITDMILNMEKAEKIRMANVLSEIGYLKQACLSSELLDANIKESSKLKELLNIMESLDNESRLLIFCFYTKMVDIIVKTLKDKGYEVLSVHGKNTKPKERQGIIDEFNDNHRIKAIVASDTLREGVDITGANCVINFDLLYNPRAMEQRGGRIDRIGQLSKKITIMNIMAIDTIEERIFERLKDKEALWQSLTGDFISNRTEKMTLKTIKDLLGLRI